MNLGYLVPEIVSRPKSVFRGIREEGDDGLCYAGTPAFAFPGGRKSKPYPNQIFLVFVNPDRIIYNWRWELSETGAPSLPRNYKTRFEKRLI